LLSWRPSDTSPCSTVLDPNQPLSDEEIDHIVQVIGASWSESTKELYGTGLLIFHIYCDIHGIPEHHHTLVSSHVFAAFLSSCAGAYSGSSISNYAVAVHAWHLLHGLEWQVNELEYKALLEGATRLAPAASKCSKRALFTLEILEIFHSLMDHDNPHDAAIFACIVCSFFCIARLGEFMVLAISKFNPMKHITRAGLFFTQNHQNLPVIKFSIPMTKTLPTGEDVHCTPHILPSPLDPKTALDNHVWINVGNVESHLFTWRHPTSGLHPLSKKEVIKRIDSITKAHPNLPDLKGHSLCIGGTLFYLLKGVPFDVIKTIRQWSSESFTLYLRHHTLILAPFLQSQLDTLNNLQQYILPPVR
ncbi:hypothetical protein SCLCIDRAFT_112887, partial [Scleroderma citrinum Foug A]